MAVRIGRGALLNLAGHGAPLAAALFAIPALAARVDVERFGFLALAWALVGYFSLFDFGLGRALTRIAAERLGTPREGELPSLARTALALTFALGIATGIVLAAAAGWICERLLDLPPALAAEGALALRHRRAAHGLHGPLRHRRAGLGGSGCLLQRPLRSAHPAVDSARGAHRGDVSGARRGRSRVRARTASQAAIAWFGRCALDAALLFALAPRALRAVPA